MKTKFKLQLGSKLSLTIVLYLMMLTYAMSFTMLGSSMPVIIKEYSLSLSQGGFIITSLGIGGFISILIGIVTADRMKKGILVGLTYFTYGLSLLLIGLRPVYTTAVLIFFILGASTRLFDTVINPHLADLHKGRQNLALNLLHTFFGIGSLLGPLYNRFTLEKSNNWTLSFYTIGFVCICLFIIYVCASVFTKTTENRARPPYLREYLNLIKNPVMWSLCLIVFLYAGHQSVTTVWLPMYMEQRLSASTFFASLSLSLFWIGIILGRLLSSFFSDKVGVKNIIITGSLSGGAVILLFLLTGSPLLIAISYTVAGIFTGAVIPLIVVVACSLFPKYSGLLRQWEKRRRKQAV
jgi:fucose permease